MKRFTPIPIRQQLKQLLFIMLLLCSHLPNIYAQRGLHFTPEEIAEWRKRIQTNTPYVTGGPSYLNDSRPAYAQWTRIIDAANAASTDVVWKGIQGSKQNPEVVPISYRSAFVSNVTVTNGSFIVTCANHGLTAASVGMYVRFKGATYRIGSVLDVNRFTIANAPKNVSGDPPLETINYSGTSETIPNTNSTTGIYTLPTYVQSEMASRPIHEGAKALSAAFAYLVLKGTNLPNSSLADNYGQTFKNYLLSSIAEPWADFSNTSNWMPDKINDDQAPIWHISQWGLRLLHGYDYTKDSGLYSANEKQRIENWFTDLGNFLKSNSDNGKDGYRGLNSLFQNRYSTPVENYTPVGAMITSLKDQNNNPGEIWDGSTGTGPVPVAGAAYYNNRRSEPIRLIAAIGIMFNNESFKDCARRFVKEVIIYAMFKNGLIAEMERSYINTDTNAINPEGTAQVGLQYLAVTISNCTEIADMFARKGDCSLYDYNTRLGHGAGISGVTAESSVPVNETPKSLMLAIKSYDGLLTNTLADPFNGGRIGYYAKTNNGITSAVEANRIKGHYNGKDGAGRDRTYMKIEDNWFAQANVYYKNPVVGGVVFNMQDMYTRAGTQRRAYQGMIDPNGDHEPWFGSGYVFPSKLFMFGQMENKVDPYVQVSLTSPANNSLAVAGSSVVLNASATYGSGTSNGRTIAKVKFYQGSTVIDSVSTSPYSFTWTNVQPGSYTITARAVNNLGIETASDPITLVVNQAPTVSITSPANNAVISSGSNVVINATAADSDGSITKVEFFQGATLLGQSVTSPYSFTWNAPASGSYSLTAKATDNRGTSTTSSVVAVVANQAPTVSISTPSTVYYNGEAIVISTTAADADGSVSKVEFYQGSTKLGESSTSPYGFIWANLEVGSYSLTAKAYDNNGAVTTSNAITITVNRTSYGIDRTNVLPGETPVITASGRYGSAVNQVEYETKAFDNNANTKWFGLQSTTPYVTSFIQYQFPSNNSYVITEYAITSANNIPARDPKSWVLEGSNDGSTFVALDTRTNEVFAGRYRKNIYQCTNSNAYKIYRLKITAVNGETFPQISELELFDLSSLVAITTPANSTTIINGQSTKVTVAIDPSIAQEVFKIEFLDGSQPFFRDIFYPLGSYDFEYLFSTGVHSIQARIHISPNGLAITNTVNITVNACSASGTILRELWTGISGDDVSAIPVNTTPASTSQLTSFEGPTNAADSYGARYRGYICAPETGPYTFWLASDNNSVLYLSENDNPTSKYVIAQLSGTNWTYPREWTRFSSQQSLTQYLEAGRRYYVEVLHKEGGGGDNLSVGWRLPSQENTSIINVIPGSVLSPYVVPGARVSAEESAALRDIQIKASPNPFNEQTLVEFTIPQSTEATLNLYDSRGVLLEKLFDGSTEADKSYRVVVKGDKLISGMYFLRLLTPQGVKHHKVILVR
jgi:hypothetical protein